MIIAYHISVDNVSPKAITNEETLSSETNLKKTEEHISQTKDLVMKIDGTIEMGKQSYTKRHVLTRNRMNKYAIGIFPALTCFFNLIYFCLTTS